MNHSDDAFTLHLLEVHPHQVVVRQVNNAVRGQRTNLESVEEQEDAKDGNSHWSKDILAPSKASENDARGRNELPIGL
jgi:hypothetical protein